MIQIFDWVNFCYNLYTIILSSKENHLNCLINGVNQIKVLIDENKFVVFMFGKIHKVIDKIFHHLLGKHLFFKHDDRWDLVRLNIINLPLANLLLKLVVVRQFGEVFRNVETRISILLILLDDSVHEFLLVVTLARDERSELLVLFAKSCNFSVFFNF